MERRIPAKKSIPLLLLGLLIFVVYLYFFVGMRARALPEMITTLQQTNFFHYSLAMVTMILAVVFHSLAWQYFLRPLSVKVPFRKTFLYVWVGIFVDLLVPAESVSGDVSKTYLMTKKSGENTGKVVASVISHRILGMIITLISLIVGSVSFVILKYRLPVEIFHLILLVACGTAISLAFLFLLSFKEQVTWKIINSVLNFVRFISRGRFKTASWRSKTKKALKVFHKSIETLGRNPTSLAQPVVFSVISWLLSVLVSFFVFVSLHNPVPLTVVVMVYSLSCALQSIPLGIPAEVGVMEIIMTTLYSFFGVSIGVSMAATILIRVLTVWLRMFIGFVAVQWIGIKTVIGGSP